MKKKEVITTLVITIISIIFILGGSLLCKHSSTNTSSETVKTAKVIEIINTKKDTGTDADSITIIFKAKLSNGQIIESEQQIDQDFLPRPVPVKEGDRIIVSTFQSSDDDNAKWYYIGVNRIPGMIILALIFLSLIVIIGKGKGVSTLLALLITILTIFMVYIPSILSGYNIYVSTIIIAIFIILSSLIILNGLNKKTLCAIVGNIGGVLIAGILAAIVNYLLHITGVIDQNYTFLTMLENNVSIDLKAVVWGGILIGSLGAVMDVAMSIASAMHELSLEMQKPTFEKMVKSGMNIGKDAIGTMTNTLILAYVGSSLAVILLLMAYNRNVIMLMNLEMIVVEVIQAIVGSIGILLAVPITVIFAAWIYNRKRVI